MAKPSIAAISQQIEEMMARKRDRLAIEQAALQVCAKLNIEPEASHLVTIIRRNGPHQRNRDAVAAWMRDQLPYPTPHFDRRAISALVDLLELQLNRGTDCHADF